MTNKAPADLRKALAARNFNEALLCLDEGVNLDDRHLVSEAIRLAIAHDQASLMAALAQAGADLERPLLWDGEPVAGGPAITFEEATPLMIAAGLGHTEVVRELLRAGVGLDERDALGKTALERAVERSADSIADLLREAGASEVTPIEIEVARAAENGNAENLFRLLAGFESPDVRDPRLWKVDMTPLMHAARRGDLETVRRLLDLGADPALTDDTLEKKTDGWQIVGPKVSAETMRLPPYRVRPGRTALHFAAEAGHEGVIDLLLTQNAKVDAKDVLRMTPLHLAAQGGHIGVVRRLLAAKAKDSAKTRGEDAWTPLELARENDHHDVAKLLLALELKDPKRFQKRLDSDLMSAVLELNFPEVERLLTAGANPNWGDEGVRPLDRAFLAEVEISLERKPAPEEAVIRMLDLLVHAGANPQKTAETPWDQRALGRPALASWLEQHGVSDPPEQAPPAAATAAPTEEDWTIAVDEARAQLRKRFQEPTFRALLAEIAAVAGTAIAHTVSPIAGEETGTESLPCEEFEVSVATAATLLGQQEEWARHGACVVRTGRTGQKVRLGVFPTTDPFEAVLAVGTAAGNYDLSPAALVHKLRALTETQPFRIVGIGHDSVDVEIVGPLTNVRQLARQIGDLAPDVLGTGSVADLAEFIEANRAFSLGWD